MWAISRNDALVCFSCRVEHFVLSHYSTELAWGWPNDFMKSSVNILAPDPPARQSSTRMGFLGLRSISLFFSGGGGWCVCVLVGGRFSLSLSPSVSTRFEKKPLFESFFLRPSVCGCAAIRLLGMTRNRQETYCGNEKVEEKVCKSHDVVSLFSEASLPSKILCFKNNLHAWFSSFSR